jgi:2,5-furandicarboxylate decarboxylase 1
MRSFLDELEQRGDLLRIKRTVNPRLEASAVLRALDDTEGPAVYFENLRGHEIPTLGNLLSNRRRLAWALEAEGDFRQTVRERLGRRLKPRKVRNAPVQEVVKKRAIDLSSLIPVFTYHEKDSGPYITCGLLMYREPESGRVNMGIYRLQTQKRTDQLSIQIVSQPLVRYVSEAEKRGEAFPVAIVLGSEPGLYLGSVLQSGPGGDKLESIGGLRGKGVEVTGGITVDVPVPAHAEMILEGRVLPKKRVKEGPMGESSGVYTYNQSNLIEVTAVTHRESYIYHALLPWSRDEESLLAVAYTIPMETRLKSHDPAVRMLHLVPGTSAMHAVVSIQKTGPGHAKDVMALCFGLFSVLKHVVVVDEDVNAEDERMVAWAMSSRFQADTDLITFPMASGFAIDPSAERDDGSMLTTKVGFDATMPMKDRQKFERIDVGEKARAKAIQILANP